MEDDDRPVRRPGEFSNEGADTSKPSAVAREAAFTSDASFNDIYNKARSTTSADSLHPLSIEDNKPLPYPRVWDLARANYRGADDGLTRVHSNYIFHAAKWPVDDPRHELMNKLGAAQTKFGITTGGDMRRENGWARTHPEEVNKDTPVPSDALQTKAALIQMWTEKYRDHKKEPTAKEMQRLLDILEGRNH